ncbi:unnamed protein product [Paramecium sonneborni]|uniref:Uncharacterized protein n=1 Tax=Paramecium sonneborni TaxID=65129 RepID=A0A8S1RSQ1_9CILI|nr:unnamed protein product [Paramecium sonneborni]
MLIQFNYRRKVKEQIQEEISQIKPIENYQKNQIKELKIFNWDQKTGRYIWDKFQIAFQKSILYIKDGQLIRTDQVNDTFSYQDILTNLDQINYLNWSGNYGKNNQKDGKWIAKWNGQTLVDIGGDYQDGKKTGLWKEMIKNIWSKAQVFEVGEYVNGHRKEIGSGEYNLQSQKIGLWLELSVSFCDYNQITFKGEYRNNQKVGRWNTFFLNQQIGGLYFDEQQGGSVKIGKWIELRDKINKDYLITFKGEYKNGIKVVQWDLLIKGIWDEDFIKIGGGEYNYDFQDLAQGSFKIGKWIELLMRLTFIPSSFQTDNIRMGRKQANGFKIGTIIIMKNVKIYKILSIIRGIIFCVDVLIMIQMEKWFIVAKKNLQFTSVISFKERKMEDGTYTKNLIIVFFYVVVLVIIQMEMRFIEVRRNLQYIQEILKMGQKLADGNNQKEYQQIGGGLYGDGGQIKIGKWVELDERFNEDKQITYDGEYSMKGLKVGRWNILNLNNEIQECGCINFDDDGYEIQRSENTPIIYVGSFKNRFKIGRWDIRYKGFDFKGNQLKEYQQIGGGTYCEKNYVKIGRWVELDEKFNKDKQIISYGEYNMKGIKVGRWDINYDRQGNREYKQIGGGSYDKEETGIKVGKWVELDQQFNVRKQVSYNGEYNIKGRKVGKWNISDDRLGNGEYKQIGGGSYYKEKGLIKIGRWIELDEWLNNDKKTTYSGEYNMKGKKVGKWNIRFDRLGNGEYKQIGGESYDKGGTQVKIGKWVELQDQFWNCQQVTYKGEYNMKGRKVRRWDILNLNFENQLCGCVNFDDDGIEIYRSENKSIIYVGSFKNHIKVGRWDISYKGFDSNGNQQKEYQQMQINLSIGAQSYGSGGGSYGEGKDQIKIGKWVELDEGFTWLRQVTYNGEYNIQGIKVGRWDINYCKKNESEYKQIGGGSYGEGENQFKVGKWIELWEMFENYAFITYNGEYNIKGMKIGRWDINYDQSLNGEYIKIGGGIYREEEGQIKIGNWKQMVDNIYR